MRWHLNWVLAPPERREGRCHRHCGRWLAASQLAAVEERCGNGFVDHLEVTAQLGNEPLAGRRTGAAPKVTRGQHIRNDGLMLGLWAMTRMSRHLRWWLLPRCPLCSNPATRAVQDGRRRGAVHRRLGHDENVEASAMVASPSMSAMQQPGYASCARWTRRGAVHRRHGRYDSFLAVAPSQTHTRATTPRRSL